MAKVGEDDPRSGRIAFAAELARLAEAAGVDAGPCRWYTGSAACYDANGVADDDGYVMEAVVAGTIARIRFTKDEMDAASAGAIDEVVRTRIALNVQDAVTVVHRDRDRRPPRRPQG